MWWGIVTFSLQKAKSRPPGLQCSFDNQFLPFVSCSQSKSRTASNSAPSEQTPVSGSPLCLTIEAIDAKQETGVGVNVVCVAWAGREPTEISQTAAPTPEASFVVRMAAPLDQQFSVRACLDNSSLPQQGF